MRSDYRPEFIAAELRAWLDQSGIGPLGIAPRTLRENSYVEDFHSRLRDEFPCIAGRHNGEAEGTQGGRSKHSRS